MCRYQALPGAGGSNGELLSLLFRHHLEFFLEASCPVEAVRAELTLGEPDGLDERFEFVEAQRGQSETLTNDFHHALIFRRVGRCVSLQALVALTFQFADDAARDELHVALRRGETDEGATID